MLCVIIYLNVRHHKSQTLDQIHFLLLVHPTASTIHYLNPFSKATSLIDRQSYKVRHQLQNPVHRIRPESSFLELESAVPIFRTGAWKMDVVYFNSSESLLFQKETTHT